MALTTVGSEAVVRLLLILWLLFPLFERALCLVLVLLCINKCAFSFSNPLAEEKRDGR